MWHHSEVLKNSLELLFDNIRVLNIVEFVSANFTSSVNLIMKDNKKVGSVIKNCVVVVLGARCPYQ